MQQRLKVHLLIRSHISGIGYLLRCARVTRIHAPWSQRVKRFYLALKRNKIQKSIYPLEGSVSIGRSPENDITLVDYNVSRTHARVSFQQGSWVVEDLGSANGIILAGERVVSKT